MRAAILSIGDEIVLGQNLDTNAGWLSAQLVAHSVVPVERRTVGDERGAIAAAIGALAGACDVLIMTGGLGPTPDDLTRDALGDVLTPGAALESDEAAERAIRVWMRRRGRRVAASNLRQALRPSSMRLIPNPNGTAPGLAGDRGGCEIFALPGPPREMQPMFTEHVLPALAAAAAGALAVTESVHLFGLGESDAAERLGSLADRGREPQVGTTFGDGVVTARIFARGAPDETRRAVEETAAAVEQAWAPYCFGRGAVTLAGAAGRLLRDRSATLVTAESCTGGWLGKAVVDEPGASTWYRGGWVTYADDLKTSCLGVPASLIAAHGAVSEPVAAAMAAGALERGGADYSLAITGVAGPGPDEADAAKPAGLVFIALAQRGGSRPHVRVREFRFRGDRRTVRLYSARAALQMLRLELIGAASAPLLWEREATERRSDGATK